MEWWKLDTFNMFSTSDLLRIEGSNNENKELWQVEVWSTCYLLWKNRNERAFSTKVTSVTNIMQEIKYKTFEWIFRRSNRGGPQWDVWLLEPKRCRLTKGL